MMTTDLGACEWFVWDLRRSNLIDRGQLDQVIGEYLQKNPGAEPPALAEFLIGQGILTDFQAERLLQGKTQGFVLGPFTLMDALGTGSMGTVYKARSKTDNNWYAVKVLPRRSMWNVRIARRKVRSFEQCRHPSVVPFVDVGTSGGMHYLAWPMVEGETLDKLVEKQGKLSVEQAAQYAVQTAEGLDLCHRQNLFHGLLKPSNLMIGPDGAVRILDFGIGCLLAETEGESLVDTMSTANSVNSGLDCASPESIMDPTNLTPLGDQYSLGCVLYYCVSGRYPFPDGTAVEKMMCHQFKQPTPLKELAPDAPEEFLAIVERLMQKNPQDRFATCGELMEALRPFAASAAPAIRRTMSMPRVVLPRPATSQSAPTPAPAPALPPAGPRPLPRSSLAPLRAPSSGLSSTAPPPAAKPPSSFQRPARPTIAAPPPPPEPEPEPIADPVSEQELESVAASETREAPAPVQQSLGTTGVVMMAILAGVVAWLLSSLIKI
jgi:serine/threonine protein kinase